MENQIIGPLKKNNFVTLFKEQTKIQEGQWLNVESLSPDCHLSWKIFPNGEIEKKIENINRENSYKYDMGFHHGLSGIHNISKTDFETILKEDSTYYVAIRNKILAREKNITLKSVSVIDNWIKSFQSNKLTVELYLHRSISEEILEFRCGTKRAYLPSGHAAVTIISLGEKFLNLSEVRKMVMDINRYKDFERN